MHGPDRLGALGQAIQHLRNERGMDSSTFAEAAGLDLGDIQAVERGAGGANYDELLAPAGALGVSAATLFDRAEANQAR